MFVWYLPSGLIAAVYHMPAAQGSCLLPSSHPAFWLSRDRLSRDFKSRSNCSLALTCCVCWGRRGGCSSSEQKRIQRQEKNIFSSLVQNMKYLSDTSRLVGDRRIRFVQSAFLFPTASNKGLSFFLKKKKVKEKTINPGVWCPWQKEFPHRGINKVFYFVLFYFIYAKNKITNLFLN